MSLKVALGEGGQINALLVGPSQITQHAFADPCRIVEDRKALKGGDTHWPKLARRVADLKDAVENARA